MCNNFYFPYPNEFLYPHFKSFWKERGKTLSINTIAAYCFQDSTFLLFSCSNIILDRCLTLNLILSMYHFFPKRQRCNARNVTIILLPLLFSHFYHCLFFQYNHLFSSLTCFFAISFSHKIYHQAAKSLGSVIYYIEDTGYW